MDNQAKLNFFSGVDTVTGANFLLNYKNKKILIDCGFVQGGQDIEKRNWLNFNFDPKSIDFLFVTHAHLDHVGRIPKLIKDGFSGTIYSTSETKKLAELILKDALSIISANASNWSLGELYSKEDIERALSIWQGIEYYKEYEIAGAKVSLFDAGHILGSTMYKFDLGIKKILFTGDLGHSPSPLLRDTDAVEGITHLIMESVYGDRNHEPQALRKDKLKRIILDNINKGGTLLIPSFSLERTQVILYEINSLVEEGIIKNIPVYVDSPLATAITEIYKNSTSLFNETTKERINSGDDIFDFAKLKFTVSREDSMLIHRQNGPKIIIAGSGMSMGGRVRQHEIEFLPDPKNTLLLVGYQPPGTLGREIMSKPKNVLIDKKKVKVRANIETIFGYSSHKDSEHLLSFVSDMSNSLQKVFVVMGEPKASTYLAQAINDEIKKIAICPEVDKDYFL